MLQAVRSRDWRTGPRTIFNRWRNYRRLPKPERTLFLQAAVVLPLVTSGLRLRGFGRVQQKLARIAGRSSRSDRPEPTAVDVATVAALVERAATKGLLRANCLERSLVLWFLLRRKGIETDLRVGVRKASETQPAMFHAWIEHEGRVINDAPDVSDRYQPFRLSLMPQGASFD